VKVTWPAPSEVEGSDCEKRGDAARTIPALRTAAILASMFNSSWLVLADRL
jgi:hypothetical protein